MNGALGTQLRQAVEMLEEEIHGRGVDLKRAQEAQEAALAMLGAPRASWVAPADAWEHLVVALALVALRVSGGWCVSRRHGLTVAMEAAAHLAAREPEGWAVRERTW